MAFIIDRKCLIICWCQLFFGSIDGFSKSSHMIKALGLKRQINGLEPISLVGVGKFRREFFYDHRKDQARTELSFWKRKKNFKNAAKTDEDIDVSTKEDMSANELNATVGGGTEEGEKLLSQFFRLPLFAKNNLKKDKVQPATLQTEDKTVEISSSETIKTTKKLDPKSYAEELQNQAKRTRLEAEKMDLQLTLQKITALEKKLRNQNNITAQNFEMIQSEISILSKKLNVSNPFASTSTNVVEANGNVAPTAKNSVVVENKTETASTFTAYKSDDVEYIDDIEEVTEQFSKMPQFLRDVVARSMGMEDAKNETAVIEKMMKYEKEMDKDGFIISNDDNEFTILNPEEIDAMVDNRLFESQFPKTTRRDGETPTQVEVDEFCAKVLDKKTFLPNAKPESVPGGFIIRGTNMKDNGDLMIEALDAKLESVSSLTGKLNFFYIADPTIPSDDEIGLGPRAPVLYVTGPNVTKSRTPILTTLLTSLGLVSISIYSIVPTLFNQDVAARVDEQLALAQSSVGEADLDFVTDLTSPVFFTYLAIVAAHEVAHFLVSKKYDFRMAIPSALVPSPTLGIISSITALRSPPKNRQALIDFGLAGPLTGLLVSIGAVFYGLAITSTLDTEAYRALPELPAAFFRQSALGSGIVEFMLGENALTGISNPNDVTLHLHPAVIAGYAGMLVNALNLTPFGRTDGGRVSLALLGRNGAQVVGFIALIFLLLIGLLANDTVLTYFAFAVFLQGEPEVPLRNEVDEVDYSRVLITTATAVLVMLTIIPM